jgi:UDPglucose--hexose-1-phosphate uridylyltransferase
LLDDTKADHSTTRPTATGEPAARIDPLSGACVLVAPWRQNRPNLPDTGCPFCPGGLEAPEPYDIRHITNRWPGLPDGRHEVVLHSPRHDAPFTRLGAEGTANVIERWSERTAELSAREDVGYVFVFENRGREIGATIDHPHSQILAFGIVPPVPLAELTRPTCVLCEEPDDGLVVARRPGWTAQVPWAPSWPYELVIAASAHVADLPAAGGAARRELASLLVDCLLRHEQVFGAGVPYMLWVHQGPARGEHHDAAHLHLHLAPVMRAPGVRRHMSSAEFGAGMFFNSVDPLAAAERLRIALT